MAASASAALLDTAQKANLVAAASNYAATEAPADLLNASTRCFGLQEQQPKEQLQKAPARARAFRHKLTCRKKTLMTATAGSCMPTVSASRTRAKRSRPAASLEKEGKGTVISGMTGAGQMAANKAGLHKKQKLTVHVAEENAQPASSSKRRQRSNVQAVSKQEGSNDHFHSQKKQKTASLPVPPLLPPVPEEHKEYVHLPGQEPYRAFGLTVHEHEILDDESLRTVARTKAQYNKMYREARVVEDARYAATGGKHPETGKNLSRRPDTLARKNMDTANESINRRPVAGHVPGVAIGDRCYLRAEMGVLGMHYPPLGGIDYIAKPSAPECPKYATSIVAAGGYEDDKDDGHELVYTGQGGNDLLGNRKQQGEQKLVLGNIALVGNIQLGVPVRVTRRNVEKDALSGYVFIYDGLYDVVKYWLGKGLGGHAVYKYLLRRRPDQGKLASSRVDFGGKSAPKGLSALTRIGVFDVDLSCGTESPPIVAVNDVNEAIVPFTEPGNILREQHMKGNPLTHLITASARAAHQKILEYISTSIMTEGLPSPPPAVLPAKFKGRPHAYVEYLNGGLLPYHDCAGSKGTVRQARRVQPVLYECGPHFGCAEGRKCSQAATLMGCPYRLEVFQTPNKGWGLRSWDLIPTGAFVIMYTGKIRAARACPEEEEEADSSGDDEGGDERHDDEYNFDLVPRPCADSENVKLPLLPPECSWEVKYVLDARHEGNAARFINHSCDPNLYVQPVLSCHHDHSLPQVCMFASQNIAPLTELTFDYGLEYIQQNLDGRCHCGTASCVSVQHSKTKV